MTMRFERYVALGDSSTEGLDDPDGRGGYRGWADRLAEQIARSQGMLEYANLGVRGRLARQVREQQLDLACSFEPDVATVVAGMNDLLRPRFDASAVVGDVHAMFKALRGRGATVVTFTLPRPGPGMPLAAMLRPRVARFNATLRAAAQATGTLVLDLERVPAASDPRLWSDDKLHANALGHDRIARGLADTIGLESADASWAAELPPLATGSRARALTADLVWARAHLLPWVRRHLRGESSGDGVQPKRPVPLPVLLADEA